VMCPTPTGFRFEYWVQNEVLLVFMTRTALNRVALNIF